MKRFIYTLMLFVLPLVLLFGALELGLRSIPNDYSFKNQWLKQNMSSVKILTLGSSYGYYSIRPQFLSEPAFNAAHVSQSIRYDAFIFDEFIDKADSLQLLIWPIAYFSLPYELEDDSKAWWRVKSYSIYYHCPDHRFDPRFNSEVVAGEKVFQEISRVYKYLFSGYTERYTDSLGFGINYTKSERILERPSMCGFEDATGHTKDLAQKKDIILANKKRMNHVIQQCVQRNIRVLLFTAPACSTYYDNLESEQLKLMVDFCDSLALTYDNTTYLNLLSDSRFEEEDFYDATHLATEGATKLTNILDDYIVNNNMIYCRRNGNSN